ncbi:MAG: hypothetical protein AAF684_09390, partial [Pseudomonadota bacterium]
MGVAPFGAAPFCAAPCAAAPFGAPPAIVANFTYGGGPTEEEVNGEDVDADPVEGGAKAKLATIAGGAPNGAAANGAAPNGAAPNGAVAQPANDMAEDDEEEENPAASQVGDEEDDDEDGVTLSLSAMEKALAPQVLETFEKIEKAYDKMHRLQEQRFAAFQKGQIVDAKIEKKYVAARDDLVSLMKQVRLNNARIESLV